MGFRDIKNSILRHKILDLEHTLFLKTIIHIIFAFLF